MIFDATVPSQSYRYQGNILQHLIFCKNEACVNCGAHKCHNLNLVTKGRWIKKITIFADILSRWDRKIQKKCADVICGW